jgi:hypothetical protein
VTFHLYLDIDGVLNAYERHIVRDLDLRWPEYVAHGREYVAPAMITALNELIADFDVKVFWLTTWERSAGEFGEKIGLSGSSTWPWLPALRFGADGWEKFDSIKRHVEETRPAVAYWIDDDLLHEPDARVWAQQSGVQWIAPHGLHGITPENIASMRNSFKEVGRG